MTEIVITKQRFAALSRLCGSLFDEPAVLVEERGPRGGLKGYRAGEVHVSVSVANGMRDEGLIDGDRITERGVLTLQGAMLDRAAKADR